jgi:hypothetical protein
MKKNEYMVLMKFLWKLTKMKSKNSKPLQELIIFANKNMEDIVDDDEQLLPPNGRVKKGFAGYDSK